MADAPDLKSVIRKGVRVRVPPRAPPKRLPYVMPVGEVEKLMQWATANTPAMVPYYALALFAGIRPAGELQRLDWTDINVERREIFVSAASSKTHDERYVKMSDNLVVWLAPYRQASGLIFFSRKLFQNMRHKAGIRYEQDCFRHSYGSYHLVHHQNVARRPTTWATGQWV